MGIYFNFSFRVLIDLKNEYLHTRGWGRGMSVRVIMKLFQLKHRPVEKMTRKKERYWIINNIFDIILFFVVEKFTSKRNMTVSNNQIIVNVGHCQRVIEHR